MFIEEIEEAEGHPKEFEVYKIEGNTSQTPSSASQARSTSFSNMSFSLAPSQGAQVVHILHSNMTNQNNVSTGLFGNLINMLNGIFTGDDLYEGGQTLDQIIQQIIINDPNKYGPPPASKDAVANLPKGKYAFFFPKDEEGKETEKTDENTSCSV